ncbi:MAG: HAD family hydrolase [Chloroflexi bacterium]|nr:MAG: HAD family hydrolase [Chloroflexota bacterium]
MALVIFDFDGVLADTLDDLIRFGQEACNQLGVNHFVTKDDLSHLEVMSFDTFGRACEVPEHLLDEFVKISLNLFAEIESPPAIFDGLNEVIRYLSTNHKLAIVTTNTAQNVRAFLTHHGLDSLVHAVYGVDTPGSKAQKISLARERFGEESVFMIGDSLSDIRAAKEAGVTSIAVTWGHQSLETLLRGEPDYLITSPDDLIEVIERRNGVSLGKR